MNNNNVKTNQNFVLENLLSSGDIDKEQIFLFKRYENNPNFIKILQTKTYNEIPNILDYFKLVEKELEAKQKKKDLDKWKIHFLPSEMAEVFEKMLVYNEKYLTEVQEIANCFTIENKWSEKLFPKGKIHITTPNDIKTIENLCNILAKTKVNAASIFVSFFDNLVKAKEQIKSNMVDKKHSVEDYIEKLPDDWYSEPWYYTYVQYFGTKDNGKGDFETLKNQLDYLEELGIKNIYILPHYQSPNGDAGYDISDYKPSKDLGGEKKFREFIFDATKRGFRVATDLVFNHTATAHKWFLSALHGESKYFNYYLKCPARWDSLDINKILKDENGDLFLYLEENDENGKSVTSKRILIFPDVDKTLWLKKKIEVLGKEILFYREFYPFQVDLDLQNPEVIDELFKFLGEEISIGILGKRTDAIAHWIKKAGTNAKDLPETYALQQLIKQFVKHISSKTIILPEVVTTSKRLKEYAGQTTVINGKKTTDGGDALFDFQLQAMLREMMYFEKTTPFWTQVNDRGEEGQNMSVQLLPIEHHDETYMGFIQEIDRMREYIENSYSKKEKLVKRGIIYKNGMSGGARYANCLNEDTRRIAAAFFCLYMMPASPVIYFGTEIGFVNNWEQMRFRQKEQFEILKNLLGEEIVGKNKPITFETCEDPRELQRGFITAKEFKKALKEKYPAVEVIRDLNRLRQEKSALRSYKLTNIDTWSEHILGMIKYPENKSENPVIVLANLCGQEKSAKIPVIQLNEKIGKSSYSLKKIFGIAGENSSNVFVDNNESDFSLEKEKFCLINLKPYECLLIEAFEVLPN